MDFWSIASAGKGLADAIINSNSMFYNVEQQKLANAMNIWQTRYTNEANLHLAREQNAYNEKMWNLNNKYNEPAAQAQRFRAAGLSAAAAAQAVQGFQSSPVQSADLANQVASPPYNPVQIPSFSAFNIIGAMREALSLQKEKEEVKQSQIKTENDEMDLKWKPTFLLTRYDAEQANIDLKKQEYWHLLQSFPYSLRSLRYKADADTKLPALRDLELKNAQANYEMVDMNVRKAKVQFGWLERMQEKEFEKMCEEIKNVKAQREVIHAQADEAYSSAELNRATTENVQEQKKGIQSENEVKEIDAIMKKYGSPETVTQRTGVLLAEKKLTPKSLVTALKGSRTYVQKGHNVFYVDPLTRDYLIYNFDEGTSKAAGLGIYSLGAMREAHNLIPFVKDW